MEMEPVHGGFFEITWSNSDDVASSLSLITNQSSIGQMLFAHLFIGYEGRFLGSSGSFFGSSTAGLRNAAARKLQPNLHSESAVRPYGFLVPWHAVHEQSLRFPCLA